METENAVKFFDAKMHNKYRILAKKKVKQILNSNNPYNIGRFIMYFGFTKIYYRKTVGHVFTKPVQIEGTTQKFFSQ